MNIDFDVEFTTDGAASITADLEEISSLRAWLGGPALTIILQQTRQQFRSEGAFWGDPWPPLADKTIKERRRQGFPGPHPILHRTGDLYRSATRRNDENIAIDVDEGSLSIEYLLPYGPPHLSGDEHLPQRAWLPVDGTPEVLRDALEDSLHAYLERRLGRRRGGRGGRRRR